MIESLKLILAKVKTLLKGNEERLLEEALIKQILVELKDVNLD